MRWLPGGVLLTTINGVEKPAITNAVLACALWSVWLGEDAIVDREKLVSRIKINTAANNCFTGDLAC
ncbi:MAG: hypothetical protein R3C26_02445 [Calditrichia bacterium]